MTVYWLTDFLNLSGKKIVVTGGGRGIGFGLCHALDKAGAEVLAISREFEPECFKGTHIQNHVLDLMDEGAADKGFHAALEALGDIDCLVNNAAFMVKDRLQALEKEDFRQSFELNVEMVHALCNRFAHYWMKQERSQDASIVNVSSYLAHRHITGSAAYRASKVALESLTESMALEWGRHGIRSNAVAPGWIKTPMTEEILEGAVGRVLKSQNPMRRLGEIDDLTPVIAFLLSEKARYINGSILPVDGGQRLA